MSKTGTPETSRESSGPSSTATEAGAGQRNGHREAEASGGQESIASAESASSPDAAGAAETDVADLAAAQSDKNNSDIKFVRRALATLCTIAVMAVLYIAQDVFIPIAMAIVISLLLRPVVHWLYRRHIPQPLGALVCLVAVLVVLAAVIVPLIGPARAWIEELPQHLKDASAKFEGLREKMGQWVRLRTRIEDLATTNNTEAPAPIPVTVKEGEFSNSAGWISATGSVAGMWLVSIVLTFFLLMEGDSLLNSVLRIMPTFRQKRHTVELIREIETGVSSYLGTVTIINIGLGIVITIVLWLMGVPNAPLWGLMTAVFNYVPFVGQGLAGLIIGLVAVLSFDSLGYALLVPIVFYCIAAVEGNIITPSMVGRRMSLNPILVILSLMVWGWMWGIAGAALAVPILAMLKIACDHFEITTPASGTPATK